MTTDQQQFQHHEYNQGQYYNPDQQQLYHQEGHEQHQLYHQEGVNQQLQQQHGTYDQLEQLEHLVRVHSIITVLIPFLTLNLGLCYLTCEDTQSSI